MFVRDLDFIAQILVSGISTAANFINCIRNCYSINMCTYKFEKNNSKENIKVVIDKEVI